MSNVADMFQSDSSDIKNQIKDLASFLTVEEASIQAAEAGIKERKANLDAMKTQLAELMQQNGMESVKLDNGLTPKVKNSVKIFKAPGVTDDQLFDWLKANDLDGIIKSTVHFNTLQSTLKDYEEQGNTLPNDLFNRSEVPSVTMYGKSKFLTARESKKTEVQHANVA